MPKKASKKLENNIDAGMWTHYGHADDDYVAVVYWCYGDEHDVFVISYHHGEMPAFNSERFDTLAELESAMRKVQGDMRKWRVCKES